MDARRMIDRRLFILGLPVALSGCVDTLSAPPAMSVLPTIDPYYARLYDEVPGER
jgi:hypothetical protein